MSASTGSTAEVDYWAHAYGADPNTPTPVTVALIEAGSYPTITDDLNHFDAGSGLPPETATSFRVRNQAGAAAPLPTNPDDLWQMEAALDVDAVRAMCHLCKILVIEAKSPGNADFAAAVDSAVRLGAKTMSISFAGPEGSNQTAWTKDYSHPGVAIMGIAGDYGMYDWDAIYLGNLYTSGEGPDLPGAYPDVISVGGTTLSTDDNGNYLHESVWNDNGPPSSSTTTGAVKSTTGGGCSHLFHASGWQEATPHYYAAGCHHMRLANDVSMVANGPEFFAYGPDGSGNSVWQILGGTSLASPLFAAMWALAGGPKSVAHPSLMLYTNAKNHPNTVHDVTVGGNGLCDAEAAAQCQQAWGSPPNTSRRGTLDCAWVHDSAKLASGTRECDAGLGYDGPSGLGSPNGLGLFKIVNPTAQFQTPATITHGHTYRYTTRGSSDPYPGGHLTRFYWNWGDGTTSTGTPATHTYKHSGRHTITLRIRDNYNRTATITHTIAVH